MQSRERREVTSGAAAHLSSGAGSQPACQPRRGLVQKPGLTTFVFFSQFSFNFTSLLIIRFWFLEEVGERREGSPAAAYLLREAMAGTGLTWEMDCPSTLTGLASGLRAIKYLKPTYGRVYPRTSTALLPADPPGTRAPSSAPGDPTRARPALLRAPRGAGAAGAASPGPARLRSHRSGL